MHLIIKTLRQSIVNLFLRSISILGKIVFSFIIARYLEPKEIGIYGIFTSSLGFAIYLVGLDFYTYSNRDMLINPVNVQFRIRDQFVLFFIVYILAIPFIMSIFTLNIMSWKLFGFFIFILIMDHIALESYRIFAVFSMSNTGTIILFIRTSVWVIVVLFMMAFDARYRTLEIIWIVWAVCEAVGFFLSLYFLKKIVGMRWKELSTKPIDWKWIKNGILVAMPFLASSVMLNGIFTFDKIFIKTFWNSDYVGVYTFFSGIYTAVISLLDNGITIVIFPKLMSTYAKKDYSGYKRLQKIFFLSNTSILLILIVAVLILINPILNFINNDLYKDNSSLIFLFITASFLYSFGLIPHYSLYIKKEDSKIIICTGLGFLTFILSSLFLIPKSHAYGASAAVCLSLFVITISKFFFSLRSSKA